MCESASRNDQLLKSQGIRVPTQMQAQQDTYRACMTGAMGASGDQWNTEGCTGDYGEKCYEKEMLATAASRMRASRSDTYGRQNFAARAIEEDATTMGTTGFEDRTY